MGWNYLSMLGLKLILVNEIGPCTPRHCRGPTVNFGETFFSTIFTITQHIKWIDISWNNLISKSIFETCARYLKAPWCPNEGYAYSGVVLVGLVPNHTRKRVFVFPHSTTNWRHSNLSTRCPLFYYGAPDIWQWISNHIPMFDVGWKYLCVYLNGGLFN